MAYRLLSVGSESDLLLTRNAVLREAGFSVQSRTDPAEALTLLCEEDFAAVLLCHLVPPKTKQQLIRQMKEHKPQTPVAVMSNGKRGSLRTGLHSVNGPEELVRTIREMIANRP